MFDYVKHKIKQKPYVYKKVLYIIKLYKAIINIRIDFNSIREFLSWHSGFVDLGPGNYKFYSNIFPKLLNKIGDDASNIIILDVGANDGWFAKIVYRFLGENVKVISFEPLRSMIPNLKELRKTYSNYSFENIAIGENIDRIEITEYVTSGLSSLKEISPNYKYSDENYNTKTANKYPVDVISIDIYLTDKNIMDSIILKVDTQGFEYEVLNGARVAFANGQIRAVIIEVMTLAKYVNSTQYIKIFDLLHSYGFKLFDLHPSYYESNGTLSEFDCAFILTPNFNNKQINQSQV